MRRHEDELFESNRVLRKLEASVRQSQELDAEDDRKEKARNSWWTYLATPIYGKAAEETEQEKSLRQMERLQRGASRRIKESEVVKQKKEVEGLLSKIDSVKFWIETEKKRAADETAAAERARRARMRDEERERQEQERRKREENLFRAETIRKQREKEERERQQKAAQEYMERMERESQEREDRWAEEARQRAREAAARAQRNQGRQNGQTNETNECRHQKFSNKIDGRHLCSECKTFQPRFAFRCPGCSKVACASCRQKLRGEGQRPFRRKCNYNDLHGWHTQDDCECSEYY